MYMVLTFPNHRWPLFDGMYMYIYIYHVSHFASSTTSGASFLLPVASIRALGHLTRFDKKVQTIGGGRMVATSTSGSTVPPTISSRGDMG